MLCAFMLQMNIYSLYEHMLDHTSAQINRSKNYL